MPPKRIFVRAPNWVGDFVMATGSFHRLRRGFPEASIVCGLRPYLCGLLDGSDFFDRSIPMPRGASLWREVASLREGRFDLAVVLPNSLRTGLVPFLARVPVRLGYRQGRPGLMTLGLRAAGGRRSLFSRHGPRRRPEPMPHYYARLLDLLGLPAVGDRGILQVTAEERQGMAAWLAERGVRNGDRLVLLNPGASFGASKLWEPSRFAAVARHFSALVGCKALLLAGPAEAEMVRDISRQAGVPAAIDPVLPLGMLKPLIERAQLLITTDTGPRHLAVALERPVVCLLGSTDPRYSSYCLDRTTVIRKEMACSPCHRKTCPLGHHDCMRSITVDEVIAAAEELLASHSA